MPFRHVRKIGTCQNSELLGPGELFLRLRGPAMFRPPDIPSQQLPPEIRNKRSLLITFYHFWTNFWEVSQEVLCTPMPLQGIVTLYCRAFKLGFFKNICSKLLKGVNAHFLSLSVTFDHFLSLLEQLLGGVASLFCAHQCLCKAL